MSAGDESYMARAIELARRGWYTARPNPRVGCVIVKDDQIIGEGWHQRAGEPHAEVNALRAAGGAATGATVYVSLEPCNHQGRTPPCAGALIEAGVSRVVYGVKDPHKDACNGLATLVEAGIEVYGPVLDPEARAVNEGFLQRIATGRPRVTLKVAASLDGRTAMASGESQWITGPQARRDVQRLRARSGAIITGIGTVLQDDPAMTVRPEQLGLPDAEAVAHNQPLRVIVDSKFRVREGLKILQPPGEALIATAEPEARLPGVETLSIANSEGKVSLPALLDELGKRHCNDVLVEAGAKLAGAFVREGLVDELIVYLAPKLLGSRAMPMLELSFDKMAQAIDLQVTDVRALGSDWRVTARVTEKPDQP